MSNIRNDGMCNQCCLMANTERGCRSCWGRGASSFGGAAPTPSKALPPSWLCLRGKNFINNGGKNKHRQTSALGTRREHGQQVFEGNYLGMVPSTCRKPICPWLFEILSYSCTTAAPARDQAHREQPPPQLGQSC